jgi:hypothetical protein
MSFDGSSKYDERSLSMAGLPMPVVYKVTASKMSGESFTFTCPEEMRWDELLPVISNEVKAYAQTISLSHTSSDMNLLLSYGTITNIGVYQLDAEIEVTVTVTDLRLWYNNFVMKAFFNSWADYVVIVDFIVNSSTKTT